MNMNATMPYEGSCLQDTSSVKLTYDIAEFSLNSVVLPCNLGPYWRIKAPKTHIENMLYSITIERM